MSCDFVECCFRVSSQVLCASSGFLDAFFSAYGGILRGFGLMLEAVTNSVRIYVRNTKMTSAELFLGVAAAASSKQLKRGVKEVVKAIRKGQNG